MLWPPVSTPLYAECAGVAWPPVRLDEQSALDFVKCKLDFPKAFPRQIVVHEVPNCPRTRMKILETGPASSGFHKLASPVLDAMDSEQVKLQLLRAWQERVADIAWQLFVGCLVTGRSNVDCDSNMLQGCQEAPLPCSGGQVVVPPL